jgi:chromosome segregation ATPase
MAEKEMGLMERMRLARELKALQTEVGDCRLELQFKDGKIQELQRMVLQLQEQEIAESIAVEEETQCSLEQEGRLQQRELVGQLADVLTQREE